MNDSLPSAVVVGVGLNGLGVLRSLAKGGMPLIAADPHRWRPEMLTRHGCKRRLQALAGPALIEDLLTLARKLNDPPVLFLTGDDSVATVSAYRDELAPYYRFQLPPPDVTAMLLTKAGFQTLAERGRFPVPPSRVVRCEADFPSLYELNYPCALKPGERNAAYDQVFAKAYRVESAQEAEILCRRILPVLPDLILQEWIEGRDDDIYFVLQYHAGLDLTPRSFTGRKIRAWPVQIGINSSCAPAPEVAAHLELLTTRFFQFCRLQGWGSMEYKRDRRTGQWQMVEPTVGRTDLQTEIATLNGCNLPLVAYQWLVGQQPLPGQATPPTVWRRDWLGDFASARAQPEVGGWASTLPVVDGYWRWDDPLPALVYPGRAISALWRRVRIRSGIQSVGTQEEFQRQQHPQ